MNRQELLEQLEGLTHDARSRRMVEVGTAAASDPETAAALAEMERGGFYERRLALMACHGSRDAAAVVRAMEDPSRHIRGLAQTLAPSICEDEDLAQVFGSLRHRQRVKLIQRLHRGGRDTAIARLLSSFEPDREDLVELLPYAPREVVSRHLARFRETADQYDWWRLGRRHPELTADLLQEAFRGTQIRDHRLISLANGTLTFLSERDPDRALALVRELLRKVPLGKLSLDQLARLRPQQVAELVLDLEDPPALYLNSLATRLDTDTLVRLLELPHCPVANTVEWFPRLKPEERRKVWEAVAVGWRDPHGCVRTEIVEALPRDLRWAEARRHLALPALATRPQQWFPYATLLPWEEALAALTPYVKNPDPDLRGGALAALIAVARYERERLGEVVEYIRARKNEQDPVRMAMLSALAALPPGAWRAEHLDGLAVVIRDALNASDLSYGTATQVEQLVLRLLPFHPEWVAEWLGTLVKERGNVSFHFISSGLTEEDVRRVAPALLPVFRSWETREREGHLLQAAAQLRKRLRVFDGLVDILERRARESAAQWTAVYALTLLSQYRNERFRELVPQLLAKDASWVTQAVVFQYLHRRRQDLLTPYLGQTAFKGRFSTGRTRFVLPFGSGFHRWTPSQQEVFARTLSGLISDRDRDTPAVLQAIQQLKGMPDQPADRLAALASDRREVVRDKALYALGGLDAGQGVPTLLEALNDDRARVAIYSLRAAVLEMEPQRAVELLRGVPAQRVTVVKEVIRLLGDLKTASAYQELLALNGKDLHRDARVALLRALWEHLERDETWAILERAVSSEDAALAQMAARTTGSHLTDRSRRRLAGLLAGLLGNPDPLTRVSVLDRLYQAPVSDPDLVLREPLAAAVKSALPDERKAAAQALIGTYSGELAPVVGTVVDGLHQTRPLAGFLETLLLLSRVNPRHLRETVETAVARLDRFAPPDHWRVRLTAAALGPQALNALLTELARAGRLHPGVVFDALSSLSEPLLGRQPAELERLREELTASDDERLRRIALGVLVQQARDKQGWSEERRALLERFREDPAPWVAEAARFTFPPEDEPATP